jgi:hypothetical protein
MFYTWRSKEVSPRKRNTMVNWKLGGKEEKKLNEEIMVKSRHHKIRGGRKEVENMAVEASIL